MYTATDVATPRGQRSLGVVLIVTSLIAWAAAFALTIDKFRQLADPDAVLSCNFSLLVQCGKNLDSWQGAVFGFPNPILGLAGWAMVLVAGVVAVSGVRMPRWFWLVFTAGMAFAIGLVIWLISQSVFVLGTLCPWCMVTWAVTIPAFLSTVLFIARGDVLGLPERGRRVADRASSWLPLLVLLCYLVVALIAQLRLDVLSYL
ncbi:vitamin K epoxide reductase family protein [Mycetocola reblochoni]|uniref:Vitamin K epoxide reductase family protein n=2 Tax=Mycetocola reblochoni TaxID=331618 RepID=A0A3L6ZQJ6_9MICO|nr:vitamin K epoxide reductase family protein [Mycetocola reblochoni]RLP69925.1 vitamin K epoxide reductase family protein [Mycetocola reblochoni]SJN30153.1 PROBABLE CONSERVED INTEGRAL MEMBRANE PROTEIN [Mycetocola reblochoni REB411]